MPLRCFAPCLKLQSVLRWFRLHSRETLQGGWQSWLARLHEKARSRDCNLRQIARHLKGTYKGYFVRISFTAASDSVRLVAICDLEKGEELSISYIGFWHPSQFRKQYLWQNYNFKCMCSLCGSTPEALAASDARRTRYDQLEDSVGPSQLGNPSQQDRPSRIWRRASLVSCMITITNKNTN